jgi:hypothetical protein
MLKRSLLLLRPLQKSEPGSASSGAKGRGKNEPVELSSAIQAQGSNQPAKLSNKEKKNQFKLFIHRKQLDEEKNKGGGKAGKGKGKVSKSAPPVTAAAPPVTAAAAPVTAAAAPPVEPSRAWQFGGPPPGSGLPKMEPAEVTQAT